MTAHEGDSRSNNGCGASHCYLVAIPFLADQRYAIGPVGEQRPVTPSLLRPCSRGEAYRATVDAAKGKSHLSELQKRILDHCLQLHGGYGYLTEYPVARAFLDTRAQTIYGGTTEIMKEVIGRDIGAVSPDIGRAAAIPGVPERTSRGQGCAICSPPNCPAYAFSAPMYAWTCGWACLTRSGTSAGVLPLKLRAAALMSSNVADKASVDCCRLANTAAS